MPENLAVFEDHQDQWSCFFHALKIKSHQILIRIKRDAPDRVISQKVVKNLFEIDLLNETNPSTKFTYFQKKSATVSDKGLPYKNKR